MNTVTENKEAPEMLIIVRHGHCDGNDGELSTLGGLQMDACLEQVKSLLKKFNRQNRKRLVIAFSDTMRALSSALILEDKKERRGGQLCLPPLSFTTREEIARSVFNLRHVFKNIENIARERGIQIIIVVAHGAMVPAFAETAYECGTAQNVRLGDVGHGEGYCVVGDRVLKISPAAIEEVAP